MHLLSTSVTLITRTRRRDTGGACWLTQLRASQVIHRQSSCALGESEEQAWVCVGAEGKEHGHNVQNKNAKRGPWLCPFPLPLSQPGRHSTWSLHAPYPGPFQVHFQLPFRTSLQETSLCFSNVAWADCQNQPSSSWPLLLLLAYLSELSFWVTKCTFPSRAKEKCFGVSPLLWKCISWQCTVVSSEDRFWLRFQKFL